MALRQPPGGLQHQLGRDRVGELGEDHDDRAALQLGADGVQAQRIVGLLVGVLQPRASHLQAGEGPHPGHEGGVEAQGRVEAGELDPVARVQAGVTQRQGGRKRVVDAGTAFERLRHAPARVHRQHERGVLLEAELLDQELAMTGRALPLDHPPVVARAERPQRLELCPLPAAKRAALGVGGGRERRSGGTGGAEVGGDDHLALQRRLHLAADEAPRSPPAHLRRAERQPPPPAGREMEGGDGVLHRLQPWRDAQPLVGQERRLQPGGGALPSKPVVTRTSPLWPSGRSEGASTRSRSRSGPTERSRSISGSTAAAKTKRSATVQACGKRAPSPSAMPASTPASVIARGVGGGGDAGALFAHLGASIRAMTASITSSTRRFSISAAGVSTMRWRRAAGASAFTSSGMT